jgi:hypothetical protein
MLGAIAKRFDATEGTIDISSERFATDAFFSHAFFPNSDTALVLHYQGLSKPVSADTYCPRERSKATMTASVKTLVM